MIAYTVRATFMDPSRAAAWLDWLRGGHIAAVLAGGASAADIVALDADPSATADASGAAALTFEVRYRFPSRAAFTAYERDHAPRLRAEGAALFPPTEVRYARAVGDVVWSSHRIEVDRVD